MSESATITQGNREFIDTKMCRIVVYFRSNYSLNGGCEECHSGWEAKLFTPGLGSARLMELSSNESEIPRSSYTRSSLWQEKVRFLSRSVKPKRLESGN